MKTKRRNMNLAAIIDVLIPRILLWKQSNILDASESVEFLKRATPQVGSPRIIKFD